MGRIQQPSLREIAMYTRGGDTYTSAINNVGPKQLIPREISRRDCNRLLLGAAGAAAVASSGCAGLFDGANTADVITNHNVFHDYELVVVDGGKLYRWRNDIDDKEEETAHSVLVRNKQNIERVLAQYVPNKQSIEKILDGFYVRKDANYAGTVLYDEIKNNPVAIEAARKIGIQVNPYLDGKVIVGYVLVATAVGLGIAALAGAFGGGGAATSTPAASGGVPPLPPPPPPPLIPPI